MRGKLLINRNCIDCEGGTAAGTEEGINEILAALKEGYSNQIAAYKLLSDAYASMATYVEKNDPTRSEAYWTKQTDVQRKLYALNPKDPEIAEAYAQTLKTDEQKIPVLRKAVEANPAQPELIFALGTSLMRLRKYDEGLPLSTKPS